MRAHRKIGTKNRISHPGLAGRIASAPTPKFPTFDLAPVDNLIARHIAVTYPFECTFGHASLEIDEGVFCPVFTKVSPMLLEAVEFRPGERVLDAFSGSGAFGINAAVLGSKVVAIDIDPLAAACARKNAAINGVSSAVDVRCGTMADSVRPGETFDLIVANPPLLPGDQAGPLGVALFDPQLQATVDFIVSLPSLLTADGRCYLVTSDVLDRYGHGVADLCARAGLEHRVTAAADAGYEEYRVHLVSRNGSPRERPAMTHHTAHYKTKMATNGSRHR